VSTFEIAAPGHVPDHYRLLVLSKLKEMGGQIPGTASITQGVRRLYTVAIEFGNTDHLFSPLYKVKYSFSPCLSWPLWRLTGEQDY
jgi:hypothetical protein